MVLFTSHISPSRLLYRHLDMFSPILHCSNYIIFDEIIKSRSIREISPLDSCYSSAPGYTRVAFLISVGYLGR